MLSILSGWPFVLLIAALLGLVSIAVVRLCARGWKSAIAIVPLVIVLLPPLAKYVFGDVSVFLPAGLFSDGANGKDQIIIACILFTFFGAIVLAALIVAVANKLILNGRST